MLFEWLPYGDLDPSMPKDPSYNAFADAITTEYNKLETTLLEKIKLFLTKEQIDKINELLPKVKKNDKNSAYKRSALVGLRQIKQSLTPKDIKFNVQNFIKIKTLRDEFSSIIDNLDLSREAVSYYAIWVLKARTAQIVQFSDIYKRALALVSFIVYQYKFFQDILVDILLRSIQATLNSIEQLQKDQDFAKREERNNATKLLTECNTKSRNVIGEIKQVVNDPILTNKGKVQKIKEVVNQDSQEFETFYAGKFIQLEQDVSDAIKGKDYFDHMEKLSIKLQHRVSDIIKQLQFNTETSNKAMIDAIEYYKKVDGKIDNKAPVTFLDKTTSEYLYNSAGVFRTSLYKALLFVNIAESIKSGDLNLINSYRYLSIEEYLIAKLRWNKEKKQLLKKAGLSHLLNIEKTLKRHRKIINEKFEVANQSILSDKNPYLKFKEDGSFVVHTPAVEKLDTDKVATLFEDKQFIPIIQILEAIEKATGFVSAFDHYSIKHKKQKPEANTFFAGIIALGCNIGVRKLARISVGVSESTLVNACNWYFSLDNVNEANDQIIKLINNLSLPGLFIKQKNLLHSSGDGKKYIVNADSLNANFSFKYFGNSKGASVYTFIDERQVLFHSLVFSSAEREAGFVIDGLLCNEEIKVDIFSTDTHGYNEIIFAITEMLGISFAPRIKKSQEQLLYSFESVQSYNKKGYKILPHKKINEKIITDNWDDILRLMVTIILKETTASQIFKRLSSYAKEHPLYKALKEFGRIIKTGFLLAYFDDVTLRQMIQKQLNKVELANKFSDAVFFANNRELSQEDRVDQEIAISCKRLIQNAIILWNYLFLSKLLAECKDPVAKDNIISIIINGSILNWSHFNFQGEYDFFQKSANDNSIYFDMEQILELKVA